MGLPIAVDGCCVGHGCDGCRTCQGGRCCRKDNPDYRLPRLGDWDGPCFGALGRLNDDGDRIECHVCGGWYRALAKHLATHDLTAREYKRLFGFTLTRGLVSQSTSDRHARAPHAWFDDPDDPRCRRRLEARQRGMLTAEQQSAVSQARTSYERERRRALGLPPLMPDAPRAAPLLREIACRACGQTFLASYQGRGHLPTTCGCRPATRGRARLLTQEQADDIRRLYAEGSWSHRSLGQRFGVKRQTIHQILKGDIYRRRVAS